MQSIEEKGILFGTLEVIPQDILKKIFSHDKVYGTVAPANIPNVNFRVSPLAPIILDQKTLDFCSAEASSSINTVASWIDYSLVDYLKSKKLPFDFQARASLMVSHGICDTESEYIALSSSGQNADQNIELLSELIHENGDDFDELYQMAKIKQIRGEYTSNGATLHDAAMALVTYGSLPRVKSPFTFNTGNTTDRDRNFLANWLNWPTVLDQFAAQHKIGSFFNVDGPGDAFDNIRSALWLNASKAQGFEVLFGLNWRSEWTFATNGVINENYSVSAGDGHCVKLIGQRIIAGVPYIVLQNSWGKQYGEDGLYYLSRNVINTEFKSGYGALTFKRISLALAQYYVENGININTPWIIQEFVKIKNLIKSIFSK